MRAADALEKAARAEPSRLQPFKRQLFAAGRSQQQEVRWHVAQLLPRLRLRPAERQRAAALFKGYLDDKSRIVQTFALQALADLALADASLQPEVIATIQRQAQSGSPAVRSRAARLLKQLARAGS
jgi:hypothetical protein